ncbi:MAG: helix-turn-helix domain-containing protein [Treponema sp.]|nr:helix-turn-helix domain-containing protein [Treponema sp.]
MANREEPGYYAVIPATVRYDKSLSPNAKLLYGEITALCKKEGYCWASNSYFANLYGVDRSSITHWIKRLADAGYVRVELVYAEGKTNVQTRKLYPIMDSNGGEIIHQSGEVIHQGDEIIHQGDEKNHQGVVKNLKGGGEKTPRILLQANNKKAAAAKKKPPEIEKPPPETTAAENSGENVCEKERPPQVSGDDVENLKRRFQQLDTSLLFDRGFYPKALNFLTSHGLGLDYVSWFYSLCRKKNPRSLVNYYYKAFLEDRYVELFREESKPPPVPGVVMIVCPVCSAEHDTKDPACPDCGLGKDSVSDSREISRQKKLRAMSPETRRAYESEWNAIINDRGKDADFRETSQRIKALNGKYGLEPEGGK